MVNSTKKLKRVGQSPVKQFIARNRRLVIIAILFLLAVLGVLGISIYEQYSTYRDRNNVIKMQEFVRDMTHEMQLANGQLKWIDMSHCTVYEPRLFGEKTRYSCDSSYESYIKVEDEGVIKRVIDNNNLILKTKAKDVSNISGYPNSTEGNNTRKSIDFTLENTTTDKCDMNYVLTEQERQRLLKIYIRCFQHTERAYFEPIKHV